jgi:uncharacterized membrane protein YqjE
MAERAHSVHEVPASQRSTAELVHDLGEQLTRLVRTEMRLAQRELLHKGKQAGKGAALLSATGVVALFGVASLIVAAILALALVVAPWLAALLVGGVLLLVAGAGAVIGRSRIRQATPPLLEDTMGNVKQDIESVREATRT